MSEALLPISDIHVGQRYRRDLGDIDALAASIKAVGLLHAIVVAVGPTGRLELVAGQRRLEACRLLGWERIPVRVITTTELLRAEHDENVVREPFTPSEAVAIAAALRPVEAAAARERMSVGGKGGEIPHPSRAADRVAAAVGMDRTTLRKAEAVVEAAEADPVLAPLVEHMDETGKVEPAHRALKALPPEPTPEQVQAAIASRELLDDAAAHIEATDADVAESRRARDLAHAIRDHGRREMELRAERWADGMTEEDVAAMHAHLVGTRQWVADWEHALDRPALRVIGGNR